MLASETSISLHIYQYGSCSLQLYGQRITYKTLTALCSVETSERLFESQYLGDESDLI